MNRDYQVTAVVDQGEGAGEVIEVGPLPSISLAERVYSAFAGHYRTVEGPHLWTRTDDDQTWRLVPLSVVYVLRLAQEAG